MFSGNPESAINNLSPLPHPYLAMQFIAWVTPANVYPPSAGKIADFIAKFRTGKMGELA
jgi:hypothetical protein